MSLIPDRNPIMPPIRVEKAVDALEIELYNKRARQHTIELEIFNNTRHFDKFV
jgi:hypothetical protein